MKTKALIGKKIKDITTEIKDYSYDGTIPLEESNSRILLESGEIFEIPFNNSSVLEIELDTNGNQKSIFKKEAHNSFVNRISNFFFGNKEIANTNLQGQLIVGILQYRNGISSKNRTWDKCFIALENGFLISEKTMSPKGTGHAGIWIFSSKDDLSNKVGKGFEEIY